MGAVIAEQGVRIGFDATSARILTMPVTSES